MNKLIVRVAFSLMLAGALASTGVYANDGLASSNTDSFDDMTLFLAADSVEGTYYNDSHNWPENVSVKFPDTSAGLVHGPTLFYNMTLTGFHDARHRPDIVIPAIIRWDSHASDGYQTGPLQFIASNAFSGNDYVTTINVPHTILGIEQPCFLACPALQSCRRPL